MRVSIAVLIVAVCILPLLANARYVLENMNVNHEKKFVFIHVPKTGGSSIEHILGNLETEGDFVSVRRAHRTARELLRQSQKEGWNWDEYFSFAVARNPWDRAVSQYHYRRSITRKGKSGLGKHNEEKNMTYSEWVHSDPSSWFVNKQYFAPTYDWITDKKGNVIVDYVIRFEDLHNGWDHVREKLGIPYPLPHKNGGSRKTYTEYYDEELKKIIGDMFQSDVEYFGYKFGDSIQMRNGTNYAEPTVKESLKRPGEEANSASDESSSDSSSSSDTRASRKERTRPRKDRKHRHQKDDSEEESQAPVPVVQPAVPAPTDEHTDPVAVDHSSTLSTSDSEDDDEVVNMQPKVPEQFVAPPVFAKLPEPEEVSDDVTELSGSAQETLGDAKEKVDVPEEEKVDAEKEGEKAGSLYSYEENFPAGKAYNHFAANPDGAEYTPAQAQAMYNLYANGAMLRQQGTPLRFANPNGAHANPNNPVGGAHGAEYYFGGEDSDKQPVFIMLGLIFVALFLSLQKVRSEQRKRAD